MPFTSIRLLGPPRGEGIRGARREMGGHWTRCCVGPGGKREQLGVGPGRARLVARIAAKDELPGRGRAARRQHEEGGRGEVYRSDFRLKIYISFLCNFKILVQNDRGTSNRDLRGKPGSGRFAFAG